MSLQVLAQARTELAKGQLAFAVVLSQAACELRTEDAFIELMRHRRAEALGEALLGFVLTKSLANENLRKAFLALTGDNPTQASWWSSWKASCKVRHGVAHKGAQVTPAQAQTAVDSAAAFIAHVTDVVDRARAIKT